MGCRSVRGRGDLVMREVEAVWEGEWEGSWGR